MRRFCVRILTKVVRNLMNRGYYGEIERGKKDLRAEIEAAIARTVYAPDGHIEAPVIRN
jgi:hypothetical protein